MHVSGMRPTWVSERIHLFATMQRAEHTRVGTHALHTLKSLGAIGGYLRITFFLTDRFNPPALGYSVGIISFIIFEGFNEF